MWPDQELTSPLVGAEVSEIFVGDDLLTFVTDRGVISYRVEGDCCSHSYFFDFHGVARLLENGLVTAFEAVDLAPGDVGYQAPDAQHRHTYGEDDIKVYGYRLTTVDPVFGPVTSVFSFRNASNGYYGGEMALSRGLIDRETQVQLHGDCLDIPEFVEAKLKESQ